MLSGIAIKGVPSELEGEVARLKVPFNKIFTTTGDKIVDAESRKVMAPLVMEQFDNLKKTSFYAEGSKDLQKIALQNLIGWAQKTAKEIATSKTEAAAYAEGKQPRLYEVQYSKLAPELKRLVNETYQQQQGKDLATTKDYATALAYAEAMRALPGYAYGGVVHMNVGGIAAKELVSEAAKAGIKRGALSLGEIVSKHSVAPAIEQTAQALATPVAKEGAASVITKTPYVKNKYGPAVSTPPVEEVAPVTKQMDEAVPETIPTKIEEPIPEIKTELPEEPPSIYNTNLNKPGYGAANSEMAAEGLYNNQVRKNTLADIKTIRQEALASIESSPLFKDIEKDAIAVAQGDYRIKTGKEFSAANPTDVEAFAEFAKGYQKKLDDLREQYKNKPPKILFHGNITERTPEKVKRGFYDPQTLGDDKTHMELNVGATSFTSDLRLNYKNEAFGGPRPQNISYTEIPYADYMFRRVNLPLDAYRKKDMNIIAQTITGDPNVARPLSIPRNMGYSETEDAFVESEKLIIKTDFDKVKKQYGLIDKQEKVANKLTNNLLDIYDNVDDDGFNLLDHIRMKTEKPAEVYKAYTDVKNLFKNEFRHTGGKTANQRGFLPVQDSNQTLVEELRMRASTDNTDIIDGLAVSFERSGAKDKALALKELSKNLKTLTTIPNYLESSFTNADVSKYIKRETQITNNIRDLVGNDFKIVDPANPKNTKRIGLAKGGLASRR
jgi:hypothetical protein